MSAKNKPLWKLLLSVCCIPAALLVNLAGCSLLPVEEQELQPPLVKPAEENIAAVEVKRGTIIKQLAGNATFQSDQMDYLYFTESGAVLTELNVKLGDEVKAGEVLASTETSDLDSKIQLQNIEIEKIKIGLEQEKADKGADDPAVRLKTLDLQSAEIQLGSLTRQLEKSRLVSRVNGIVTYIEPIKSGDKVTAFTQLITVSDPRSMKLVYSAGSRGDLAGVAVNMDVSVQLGDQTYQGKVVQTPMTAPPSEDQDVEERNSKSLIIDVPDLPDDVAIGTHAQITIVTEKREDVLIIPRSGLRTYLDRDFVQILEGESRKETDVQKGIVTSTEVEIQQGIEEGQMVILNH